MALYTNLKEHSLDAKKQAKNEFARDVLLGLSMHQKKIPSKYLYDDAGSRIFGEIMRLPEYYLTNSELEVLRDHKAELAEFFSGREFNLIELGPGNGTKTLVLLEEFLRKKLDFTYVPIDISEGAIKNLSGFLDRKFTSLKTTGVVGEYFEALRWLAERNGKKNLILFLGSNIGNFNYEESRVFLHTMWNSMNNGDCLLMGFDLKKGIGEMLRAYNDSSGLTSKFNLNLLERMNRELGANFDAGKFRHYETYGVYSGAMHSYLICLEEQDVSIREIGKSFHFREYEAVHTEYSYKYLLSDIESLARETGFGVCAHYFDSKKGYVDSLWIAKKSSGAKEVSKIAESGFQRKGDS